MAKDRCEIEGNLKEIALLIVSSAIITAAMEMLGGKDISKMCRKVDIMSDAAYVVLTRDSKSFTGNFVIDEDILREEGVRDFDQVGVAFSTTAN